MIDLKYLQNHFEEASAKLQKKGVESIVLAQLQEKFKGLKEANAALEAAKAEQNSMSKLFGEYMREKRDITELKAKVDANKEAMVPLQENARQAQETLDALALAIPNFPDDSVPEGADEEENVELRKVLEPKAFTFQPKEHWELAQINGWIDFERGVKLAKSRFSVLRGEAAKLERALINFFLETNGQKGFEEFCVPFMNNAAMLQGTGQ
ncbi:MAG: seryl-tRNA synthetase, partial [Pseudomonadota bacterium]